MKQAELQIGMRVWSPIFGWGTLLHPPTENKSLVDFDFKECSYYIMGKGYKTFKKEDGDNIVFLPNDELFENDKAQIPPIIQLKKKALNPTVTY